MVSEEVMAPIWFGDSLSAGHRQDIDRISFDFPQVFPQRWTLSSIFSVV
jgi:hypothetical protein